MSRFGLALLLLVAAAAAEDDARTVKYRAFFAESIEGKFREETLAEARAVMLREFDKHDVPDAARWLMLGPLSDDPAADVRREAVRVLSGYKNPNTVEEMASLWRKKLKKPAEARVLAMVAFGGIKNPAADPVFVDGLKDKDARVVAATCKAIGKSRRLALKDGVVKLLKHKHFVVRAAAVEALAELRASDALADVFTVFCKDESNRVRYDAWRALCALGLQTLPCDPVAWREWWEKQAGEVAEGEPNPWGTSFPSVARSAGAASPFFGIPLLGDRICFVIDVSTSSSDPWKVDHAAERAKPPEERIPNFFSVKTRWGLIRNTIEACLEKLPPSTEVAFVFFSEKIATFPDNGKFLKLSAANVKKIAAHLNEVDRGGGTAMFEGLQAAWNFVADGHPTKNLDRGCDTIVFLTDGQPKDGALKDKPDRIKDEAWQVATIRNLRIHTVGIFNHAFALCQGLAKDSGGLYVHLQPDGDTAEPQDLEFWPEKKKAFEEARKKRR